MEINRTAVVKLSVPIDRRSDLKRTMNTFRDATQRFADRAWDGDDDGYVITSGNQLQRLVYDDIREDTGLHADLAVAAADHAANALDGCVEKMKAGERTSKPVFRSNTSNTTVYNTNAITYFNGYCSLAAYGGSRVHAEYVYPDGSIQAEYMESDEWQKQGGKLRYDHQTDTYYLHVSLKKEREETSEEAENQSTVLGVDRNVEGYLAVTSTGAFIGNADLLIDLLHALKDVESDHRISAECGVRGSNPHSRGTGSIPGELSFPPLYRAVARSTRPHRNPCHRRANHRRSAAPCGSGPASHRFRSTPCYTGPHQNGFGGKSGSHSPWVVAGVSARPPPACSLLGSDRASEHSSLTGRRGYALVSLSGSPE